MPAEKNKILKFNEHMPYIIYADIKSLIKKIDGCENNPESSSTTKIGEHISYGFPMSTILEFDHIKSKHTVYRGKDCTKCFFGSLKENAKNITDLEKKKTLLLTKKE